MYQMHTPPDTKHILSYSLLEQLGSPGSTATFAQALLHASGFYMPALLLISAQCLPSYRTQGVHGSLRLAHAEVYCWTCWIDLILKMHAASLLVSDHLSAYCGGIQETDPPLRSAEAQRGVSKDAPPAGRRWFATGWRKPSAWPSVVKSE